MMTRMLRMCPMTRLYFALALLSALAMYAVFG